MAIARNNCAGRKQRDVARHNFHERNENFRAIAQHAHFRFHHRAQFGHRMRRAVFLPEAEKRAHQDDRENQQRVGVSLEKK